MIKKLQKKFILISAVAVVSVMVLLCIIVNAANFISVNSKLNATLEMITSNEGMIPDFDKRGMPAHNGETPPEGDFGMPAFDNRHFNAETPFSTRFFVLCYNESGELTRSNLDKIAAVTQSDTAEYLDIAVKHGEGYGFTNGYKYRVVKSDSGYMAVFLDDSQEISSIVSVLILSIAATVICSALICVLIVLFSKRAIKPVIESNRKQKQFITDASHELKTPITVISTSLGVLEMEVGKQKWIDKAKAQTEKLTELVNSLVTLSKMDEEDSPLNVRDFNVSDAVRETAGSFSDFAEQSGHALQISVAPALRYSGDEYSIRQLTSILLDNAIKYADKGTPIKFSLEKDRKGIVITSENESEGIDVSELDKLFDRFYRADKSRNSQTGGFGIGLSIARSIAEAHRGSIEALCDNGHTVRFIAKLR